MFKKKRALKPDGYIWIKKRCNFLTRKGCAYADVFLRMRPFGASRCAAIRKAWIENERQ